ncbi:hypothetical protein OB2597_02162 [Pseudooceanicola batsensis HTCC2597]|uniref:Type IV pilus biogenesis n=1 Tax=Pseudooceanicola batsensis (strain ATCC BAA-863 / DSM 15984 / KCTC 12145 / HTCC2597) TaxID=252305 RepID=A3TX26_PSEBH|nr:hypothetical protein [Pseudooceanicola batsensis]EAQ03386.1 hypothetical protein OB2597_02162 [Pseudooceanicola batsensis HTCC2597]
MKPNFALILSMEGIALLQRSSPGWALVGEASPESPGLAGEMAKLRAAADRLAPGEATFKVVIPNDQIRYVSVPAGPADPRSRQQAIADALDGQTPYALDELATDSTVSNGTLQIAAVALETLQEADEFARGFGFEPVSFAAMPETADYAGEPFFGTAHDVPPDIDVEPDHVAIRVSGRVTVPSATEETEEPETPETDEAAPVPFVSVRANGSDGPAEAGSGSAAQADEDSPPAEEAGPAPAPKAGRSGRAGRKSGKPQLQATPPEPPAPLTPPHTDFETPAPAPQDTPRLGLAAVLSGLFRRSRAAPDDSDPASGPPRTDTAPAALAAGADMVADPAPSAGAQVEEDASAGPSPREEPTPPPAISEAPVAEDAFAEAEIVPPRRTGALTAEERKKEAERLTVFGARNGANYDTTTGSPVSVLAVVLAVLLAGSAAWAAIFMNEEMAALIGAEEPAAEPQEEPAATVEEAFVPPGPGTDAPADATAGAEPGAPETAETEATAAAPIEDMGEAQAEAGEDGEEVSPLIVTEAAEAQDETPETETAEPTAGTESGPAPATGPEAEARYAATGIWQQSPDPLDPDTLAAEDGTGSSDGSGAEDAPDRMPLVTLAALRPDVPPEAPGAPPIPGKRYDMDDRGLVVATPDGAETPSGVLVFTGDPDVVPPPRPEEAGGGDPVPGAADDAALTPAPAAVPGRDAEAEAQRAEVEIVKRPRPRPAGPAAGTELAVAGQSTADADAAEDTVALAAAEAAAEAVARASAAPRPAALVEDGPRGSVAAGLAGAGAAREDTARAEAAEIDRPEPEFVALRPLPRPGNIAELAAVARATPEPPPSVVPAVPSVASVTRQATLRNAIDLSEINLIGVYGQPADRRALVRLANGRYRKVKVGDRIDGGRVLAIGDATLRYQKNGRNMTLDMPSS